MNKIADTMANRVSNEQLNFLLDFLLENPGLAKGVGLGPRSKETVDQKWNELADRLNSFGSGSAKSGDRWKKYWADIKHKCKARVAKRRREAFGTGGGPSTTEDINETEKKILEIIGEQAVFGDTQHRVPLFNTDTNQMPVLLENEEIVITENQLPVSTREQPCTIYTSETTSPIVSHVIEMEKAEQSGPETPVVSPKIDRRKLKRRRLVDKRNTSEVRSDWVIDLERRRVESEEKLANAATVMANAATVMANAVTVIAEASRMEAANMRELTEIIRLLLNRQ